MRFFTERRYTVLDALVFMVFGSFLGLEQYLVAVITLVIGIPVTTAFETWLTYGWDKE